MTVQTQAEKDTLPTQTTALEGGHPHPILEMSTRVLRETRWLTRQSEATLRIRPSSVYLSPQLEQDSSAQDLMIHEEFRNSRSKVKESP